MSHEEYTVRRRELLLASVAGIGLTAGCTGQLDDPGVGDSGDDGGEDGNGDDGEDGDGDDFGYGGEIANDGRDDEEDAALDGDEERDQHDDSSGPENSTGPSGQSTRDIGAVLPSGSSSSSDSGSHYGQGYGQTTYGHPSN